MKTATVNVSNRHIHLSQEHLEMLFGKGYELTVLKVLLQPTQFAAKETVDVSGPRGSFESVRIVGPVRKATQVELTVSDARKLGIKAPLRLSGNLEGSAPAVLKGPKGTVELKEGCIVAKRHVHMPLKDAEELGIMTGTPVLLRTFGERSVIFENVIARADKITTELECHLDIEEANAALIQNGDKAEIIK